MTEHKFTPVISALRAAYISEMIHQTEAHDHDRVERFGEQFDRAMRTFARERAKRAEQALQRVRELHQPRMNSMSALYPEPLCSCQSLYPCPTIRALEDYEPAEPVPEYECLNNAGEWRPCPVPTCHRQRRRTGTKTPNP